jgi:2-dehydro-3-deoxyglucarate aldolase/4-hydroxy-2-oxoheptanedioate aldolase
MRINKVKQGLREGKVQIGCGFAQVRSQDVLKVLALAGFDWAFLDSEHGGFDLETLQDLCRIAPYVGFTPLIRVANMEYDLVARALDLGAMGVVFPRVEDPKLLEEAVSWTKFPPVGVRGFGLLPLAVDYEPMNIAQMAAYYNEQLMNVLQIETVRAFEAREELLSVKGVDAVMVGPVDLSISLGVPGQFDHPKMVETMEKIIESCQAHGVAPGTQTRLLSMAQFWKQKGMLLLGTGNEISMLFERAREIVTALK